jgi:DNA-binding transcriptional MerR regulator
LNSGFPWCKQFFFLGVAPIKMDRFSIKDIEALTGIRAATLRMWETRYGLVEPKRSPTKIRYYDQDDLRKLLGVSALMRQGAKISHLAKLDTAELHQAVLHQELGPLPLDERLEALTLAMISLDEPAFLRLLTRAFDQYGVEEAMMELIFPFFRRIGILWQTGSINPAHEHFITNIIRQKLVVAIDRLAEQALPKIEGTPLGTARRYLLYLPEGEFHELGLLFACYILKARGQEVAYIGANVPYPDLFVLDQQYRPDFTLFSMTSSLAQDSVPDYLARIKQDFPRCIHLVTGPLAVLAEGQVEWKRPLVLIKDFKELINRIVAFAEGMSVAV